MTTLPYPVSVKQVVPVHEELQAPDNFVLATRVVHRAETLLAGAEGYPEAVAHIEAAIDAALALTVHSSWSEVRAAREHLDAAQAELDRGAYRLG